MISRIPSRVAAVSLAVLSAMSAAHAGTLIISTVGATVVNSSADLVLNFTLSDPLHLSGVTFLLDWGDKSGLSFQTAGSKAFGSEWGTFLSFADGDPGVNSLTGQYTMTPVFGDGVLNLSAGLNSLSLHFKVGDQSGPFPVNVTYSIELSYPDGFDFDNFPQYGSFYGTGSADINVTSVPEPQPELMLLAGLGALGWLARRRPA